ENRLSAMTIGAKGVKVYGNLSDARIINTNFTAKWQILKELELNGSLGYALGTDDNGDNLPLISPFSYGLNLAYIKGDARVQFDVKGNGRQKNYAAKYGETETPEYVVLGLSGSYNFSLRKALLTVRAGVENLLDKRYSAFSDWCDIPQKGRNFYLNLAWSL
ncbi:MAG: TonB-dependent receptor, partial [Bacteroidaceae bacterium]|nr:TonB-dependent receptor [Bacteroidaceae bacterium]